MSSVEIATPKVLAGIRESCRMAADALLMVGKHIRQGITTDEINTLVHEYAVSRGARPSPLNYRGFPKSVCTSPNEIVCHGIPSARIVKEGDILNVDITFCYPAQNGFHGDTSATFYIGQPSNPAKHVVEVARHCLDLGIAQVREGNRIGDIGAAIQEYAEANGCSVVRDFVGHGIGREFHSAPQVPHFGKFGTGKRLKAGMVFTVEPMINLGGYECEILGDGWTVSTRDRSLSAQFEHTVVVTKDGCEILTARSEVLKNSEDVAWLSTEQV